MRVQIVDPPAYTPPYDHALAGALAHAGAEVELITCHFPYGSVPEEQGYRRVAEQAAVVHYQWLPIPALDRRLLPPKRPRVYAMHWRLPEADSRIGRSLAGLLAEMDAVVVHSDHGSRRLEAEFGVPAERLRVIPHGAFTYLTEQADDLPLPAELRAVEGPVILAFGLIRPYKGIDVLLEAMKKVEGAELWIAGMPRMPMDGFRELAQQVPGTVRFVDRFI